MKIIRHRQDKKKNCWLHTCKYCGAMFVLENDESPWSFEKTSVKYCPECHYSLSDNYDFDYYPCDEDGNV